MSRHKCNQITRLTITFIVDHHELVAPVTFNAFKFDAQIVLIWLGGGVLYPFDMILFFFEA